MRLSRRSVLALTLGVPASLLALAYLWLAVERGTLALWGIEVHESGRYTMRETVLYFRHFLREVPTDIAYAGFLVSAFLGVGREAAVGGVVGNAPGRARLAAALGLGAAAALLVLAYGVSVEQEGSSSAVRDLLQFRTRDDLDDYGSHWRFHWLSTVWFGVAAHLAAASVFGLRTASGALFAWGYFAILTAVFGLSGETFTDPRYVGHQAREILTHGPITLLLVFGVLHLAGTWIAGAPRRETEAETGRSSAPAPATSRATPVRFVRWVRPAVFAAIPLYLAVVAIAGDAMMAGQTDRGLAAMVAGHAFEHALDYVFVTLLAVGGYGVVASRAIPGEEAGS